MSGFVVLDSSGATPTWFGESDDFQATDHFSNVAKRPNLSQTKITYVGELPIDFIEANSSLSRTNWRTKKHIKAVIGVTGFVKPLLLDRNFKIIDGELRLEIVKELAAEGHYTASTVSVVVVDAEGADADFIRVAVNRMGEFARWDFKASEKDSKRTVEDLPEFIDANPQLQKLMEPFGFWAGKLLSDSYFSNTVLELQPKLEKPVYSPEIGLVKWAAVQEELHKKKLEQEAASPLKTPGEYDSIFALSPTEDDFVKTYAIEDEVQEYTLHMRDVAGVITDHYDAKRRAEKEAKGQEWQTKRRGSKAVIADMKQATALAEADEFDNELGAEAEPATPALDDPELTAELNENEEDDQ